MRTGRRFRRRPDPGDFDDNALALGTACPHGTATFNANDTRMDITFNVPTYLGGIAVRRSGRRNYKFDTAV